MEREEIEKLAELSRLRLTEEELTQYQTELSSILDYVSHIQEVSDDVPALTPEDVSVANIFREDEATHEPGQYTDQLLASAPDTKDGYVKVKKIL